VYDHDHMVVGFTTTVPVQSVPIITNIASSNPVHVLDFLHQ